MSKVASLYLPPNVLLGFGRIRKSISEKSGRTWRRYCMIYIKIISMWLASKTSTKTGSEACPRRGGGVLGSNWACHRGQGISSCFLTQDEAQCENWEIHPKLTDKRISMLLHKFMHYVSLPSSAHETQMYDQEYDLHLPSLVLGLFIINEFCNWVVLHDVIQLTRHKQRYRTHWGLGFRGIWSSTCQIWYNVIGWCVFVFNLIYYF